MDSDRPNCGTSRKSAFVSGPLRDWNKKVRYRKTNARVLLDADFTEVAVVFVYLDLSLVVKRLLRIVKLLSWIFRLIID
jgi:hypothetical protein